MRLPRYAVAYLDDICLPCQPERVVPLYQRLENYFGNMPASASTQPKLGCGMKLALHPLTPPSGSVSLLVLGVPFGAPAYVDYHLSHLADRHGSFLQAPPGLGDTQSAWLLLLYCASPRAQYAIRMLPPSSTARFAAAHDRAISSCLAALLHADLHDGLPALAVARAQLALRHGGLGLRSAARHGTAAYWASWADSLRAIAARAPGFADRLLLVFDSQGPFRQPWTLRRLPVPP